MAQGLFADLIRGRRDIEVTSAGIGAIGGQPPSPYAVEVMAEIGIDIRHIRSKPLMVDLVRKADFIFVMTYGHLDSMLLLFPSAAEKTFLLREFETDLPVMEREVSDPIGQARDVYSDCRDQIREALPRLLDLVLRSTHDETRVTARKRVAIAADTPGTELKEQVRTWLELNGFPCEDLGGCGTEEVASRVGLAVAQGVADSGIVIDQTGLGLSMAANKIPGVRAALVHNVEMARLSRERHDANLLSACHRWKSAASGSRKSSMSGSTPPTSPGRPNFAHPPWKPNRPSPPRPPPSRCRSRPSPRPTRKSSPPCRTSTRGSTTTSN